MAAVLYGIGVRLDEQPELAFALRAVDHAELIASAAKGRTLTTKTPASAKVLDRGDLSALFGLEMEGTQPELKTKASVKGPLRPLRSSPKKKLTEPGRLPAKTSGAKLLAPAALPKAAKAKAGATDVGKRKARSKP